MSNNTIIIIAIITLVLVVAAIALYYYKKRNLTKLFEQIRESARQIPKQKKNSFLLLMFMETMSASSKKQKAINTNKLNNPKYLEIQLIKTSKILKDNSIAKDKKTKRSLTLLNDYLKWEKTNMMA